jgi:hypothetical protein
MKQYTTHCTRINVVDGQHPNYPHDPFWQFTAEGWRVVTATIHARGPEHHPYEASIYALLERDSPEPQPAEQK